MKEVLISIQPKWVEKIVSGKKTIEVRKTKPNLQTPFKCYIYMTKAKPYWFEFVGGGKMQARNGMVIGEFVCDRIICSQAYFDERGKNHLTNVFEEDIKRTCLTEYDLWNYMAGKAVKANQMYDGYLWHISNLKIYDKPKELSEFKRWNRTEENSPCANTKWLFRDCKECAFCNIKRQPQSWCYVEELK